MMKATVNASFKQMFFQFSSKLILVIPCEKILYNEKKNSSGKLTASLVFLPSNK